MLHMSFKLTSGLIAEHNKETSRAANRKVPGGLGCFRELTVKQVCKPQGTKQTGSEASTVVQ